MFLQFKLFKRYFRDSILEDNKVKIIIGIKIEVSEVLEFIESYIKAFVELHLMSGFYHPFGERDTIHKDSINIG